MKNAADFISGKYDKVNNTANLELDKSEKLQQENLKLQTEIEDNMNDVCRFSRDHVVECSERTVLSCLEPVCLCWRPFGRYFSHHLAKSGTGSWNFRPKGDGRSGP